MVVYPTQTSFDSASSLIADRGAQVEEYLFSNLPLEIIMYSSVHILNF